MMPPSNAAPGDRPASPLGQAAWALYEFGTGPYFILINIFVFSAYFAGNIVGDPVRGQTLWGYLQGAAGFIIALSSPFLGALSDAAGPRKPGVAVFTLAGVVAIALLWYAVPGAIGLAATCVICAAITMEFAGVHHQAMLAHIVSSRRVGFVSGMGFALSNFGAVLILMLWISLPFLGVLPDLPFAHERSTGFLTAVFSVAFLIPLLLFTPDQARSGHSIYESAIKGAGALMRTALKLDHYGNVAKFLIARMLYYDGLNAVFIFIGIYAKGVFGWSTGLVGVYAMIVILVGAFSAVLGGWLDDHVGSKRTIAVSLFAFLAGVILSISMDRETILFTVPISAAENEAGVPLVGPVLASMGFTLYTEQLFVLAGLIGGIFAGPAQASSRTMLTRLVPQRMAAEFFGLYTLTGRATSWLAPTAIAIVTDVTQSQRYGFAVVVVFIALGLWLLLSVREERIEAAG